MKYLTRAEAIRLHRELWSAIALLWKNKEVTIESELLAVYNNDVNSLKSRVILSTQSEAIAQYGRPKCDCWCCAFDGQFHYHFSCSHCPLDWENYKSNYSFCANAFYKQYVLATHWITKYYWANRIANLSPKSDTI